MKKIILITILQLSLLMAGSFVMTKGNPLIKADTASSDTTAAIPDTTSNTVINNSDWAPKPLPTQKFNVLDYGLKGDGVTDDSAALKALAKNTNVTNWYFPTGYTFRLYGIDIPSHVNTVWGGGTLKTIYQNTEYPKGVFFLTKRPSSYLLIDGMNFTYTQTSFENGEFGAICLHKEGTVSPHNVEIRNSTFTGNSSVNANGISIHGKSENGGIKHIYIHNNSFYKLRRAAIELVQRSDIPAADNDGIEDVNIFQNNFNPSGVGGWKCAVSFSQVRQSCVVHNNIFNANDWDIEINQSDKIEIHNNESINCNSKFISYGSSGWHGNDVFTLGKNHIHHNSMVSEVASIHIYDGMNGSIHDNFINGTIWTQEHENGWGAGTGEIYNNTIVKDAQIPVEAGSWTGPSSGFAIEGKNIKGISNIHDNDIYMKNSGSWGMYFGNSDATTTLTNNVIRRNTNDTNCLNSGNAIVSQNSCIPNFTGIIPTERVGAGLSL